MTDPVHRGCVLSHDFHNDLHVILGRCELLIPLLACQPDVLRHVSLIKEAALHMNQNISRVPCPLSTSALPEYYTDDPNSPPAAD